MKLRTLLALGMATALAASGAAVAGVSAEEAAKLKTTLTPFGGERAGNADGTIPAWDGGYTQPLPDGRRSDPFADEKPLYSITAGNYEQYADKLSEGQIALLKKYPDYRLDVYPTHRTAAAPQWVYDNTLQNAEHGKLEGGKITGAYGGIPFPIPGNGEEAIWNHLLRWHGESVLFKADAVLATANGKLVLTSDAEAKQQQAFYIKGGSADTFDGSYWNIRFLSIGPAVRAGEAFLLKYNVDSARDEGYVYLTGQRRVRKIPNACCDTPLPATNGILNIDESYVFVGRTDRFDWKLVGKKELYVPYNSNRVLLPKKNEDIISGAHLNPDHVRWELHRVWAVEANLRQGQRHTTPKNVYYLDEDTWLAVLADRWDSKGQLWKTMVQLPVVMSDLPGVVESTFGFTDLLAGTGYFAGVWNEKADPYKFVETFPATTFTPDALAGEGVR